MGQLEKLTQRGDVRMKAPEEDAGDGGVGCRAKENVVCWSFIKANLSFPSDPFTSLTLSLSLCALTRRCIHHFKQGSYAAVD